MQSAIVIKVLSWVLPVLLGPIVYYASRELLNVSRRIDDLPPSLKRVVVTLLGMIVSASLGVLGIAAPAECAALLDPAQNAAAGIGQACANALGAKVPLQGIVAALTAMLIHRIKKQRPQD